MYHSMNEQVAVANYVEGHFQKVFAVLLDVH